MVLAAVESTLALTRQLISWVAGGPDVEIEMQLVVGACGWFATGGNERFHAVVAEAIADVGEGADVVVLAQASMAGAADRVTPAVPVLTSPRLGVERLLAHG